MAVDDLDIVPGTVYLVDLAQNVEGQHVSGHADIVKVPQPSADPEDPLNWSWGRKMAAIGACYGYVLGVGIATTVQYSVLTQISEDTGITVAQLNLGTGLMFLFLGWGCLLWQPLALVYGRRGVYIASCVLCIAPMVWSAYSKTKGEWYAHRIIIGILASPIESLPEVTVPDLFFAHERGTYMSLYAFVLFGSNFFAPFLAGFIDDGVGWRWTMLFGAILLAFTAVCLFFTMEETMYFRQTFEGVDPSTNTNQGTIVAELKISEEVTSKGALDSTVSDHIPTPQEQRVFPPARTYIQKLNLFRVVPGRPSNQQLLTMMYRPLLIMLYFPCTLWSGLLYGTNLSWYNVLNATASSILSASPYNFAAKMVGTAYLSPLIGAGVAALWSGKLGDKVALYFARRNNGVREPEQRLWTLLVSGIITPAGLILWGVGAANDLHFMGLMFGIGMVGFGVVSGGATALSYNVDCFKELGGETLISVIIVRNSLGFGFSYAINPWIETSGLKDCFIAVGMVSLACTFTFLFMIAFGKKLRRFSRAKYWEYVATSVSPHL